jgi:hypothetical protein
MAFVYTDALLAYSMIAFSHRKNLLSELCSRQVKIKRVSTIKPSVSKQTLKLAVIFVQNQNNEAKVSCIQKRRSCFRFFALKPEV